jgi:hypothetical protein
MGTLGRRGSRIIRGVGLAQGDCKNHFVEHRASTRERGEPLFVSPPSSILSFSKRAVMGLISTRATGEAQKVMDILFCLTAFSLYSKPFSSKF